MKNEGLLDRGLISRIEKLIGAKVESYSPVSGGYTPAIRLLCRTSTTSFFAKIGATPLTTEFLRREIRMYNSIRGAFMPTLLACEDNESAPILLIEDLSTHYWPPPWDQRRIDMVLEQINIMHNTPASIEPFAETHGDIGLNWQIVADDPALFLALGLADDRWLDAALPTLLDYEARCVTAGHSLTHFDIRSDNICITQHGAIFVDWNNACLSNPKFDLGFWLPSLEYEGGPVPERILPDAPEVAARVSGFFAYKAGLPEISDAPRVRLVQKQQLETALPWAIRALELPPLVMRRLT